MIDARTTVGPVELAVSDVGRSVAWYRQTIGLEPLSREDGRASIGAGGRELVRLVEESGARSVPGSTGLFHFALRVPDRPSLARWLAHAVRERVPLQGMSDHFVSEAIYLGDPDGHGIEIYRDRPRAHWEGLVDELRTDPLDVAGLLGEVGDTAFDGLPAATDMGHVHFRVRDVGEAIGFYRDVLGLELMATYGDQAAFLAAGGYHHHVGVNTWQSRGGRPAPEGAACLRAATLVLPDAAALAEVRGAVEGAGLAVAEVEEGIRVDDPSGVPLLLTRSR